MADKSKAKKAELSGEEHKNALLATARKHFARHGFQGANLKDIAADVGVANSLIHYHFTDKEGLFQACMEPFARDRMEAILRILGEPKNEEAFKVRIELFAEEMLAAFVKDPHAFDIVDREVKAENPIILKIFENTMLKAFRAVVDFFKQAKEHNLLREDCDPLIVATLLFSSCCDAARKEVIGKRFLGLSFQDPVLRKKFSSHVVELFSRGVLK